MNKTDSVVFKHIEQVCLCTVCLKKKSFNENSIETAKNAR